ncbi:DNA polymerase delta subunit 4 protein [Dioscorea alata]|uniref:DNA polymerase delta subunit 4 protein n=1 Tax=Dioscorea alata TaxID=55571 RepID=A0ACB7WH40_DIOAL|nr:DNA polymerase delta subunit 4 protein [Dioscorea alata]
MATSDIKGFYKQRKKSGVGKAAATASSKKRSGKARAGVSLGAGDSAQNPALVAHGSFDLHDEYDEMEVKLRQFDMDMKYGPCLGLTRLERWNRAESMGLHPPLELGSILEVQAGGGGGGATTLECLWEGRV